ncbi:AraC family transcriptional regulator [Paenibacillus cisolokensis]|uniref:helix-turn-helix domain-containing protein n=1 Tax=Paenibacillus cisolokensis TaxID=1658519 RepID=UPI003D29353E
MLDKVESDGRGIGKLDQYMYRLRSVEYVQGISGERLDQRLASAYSLVIVTNGHVRLELDHVEATLDGHSVYFGMPGQTFGTAECNADLEMYIVHFDVYLPGQVGSESENLSGFQPAMDVELFPRQCKIDTGSEPNLPAICRELYNRWIRPCSRDRFRSQIEFQKLLLHIELYRMQQTTGTTHAMASAKRYIEEHFREPITAGLLAGRLGLSPKYFAELFHKMYGKSVTSYVTELRLREAKRLMLHSRFKLRDIAHRVGYADEFYFSRKFKKEIGVSPTSYMNSRRRKLVAYRPWIIGHLLALNVMPYAAPLHPKWTESYYRDYRHEIPIHLSAYRYNQDWRMNVVKLGRLAVDLIVTTDDLEEQEKRALGQIAPLLCLPRKETNWREQLQYLAAELGETWQAGKWLEAYEHKARDARKRLQPYVGGKTFVGLRMVGNRLYLHCNGGMADVLYRDLGLSPACRSETPTYDRLIAVEEIDRLNADYMLMLIRRDNDTLAHWTKLQNDPQWQAISAVQRKRVYELPSDPWREYSAHAMLRMLEYAEQLLTADHPSLIRI